MTRIFLVGFMGAGKSTLGKALALDLGLSFIDLDAYIESRYMKSISELFSSIGESRFREVESRLLREAGEFEDAIISCGGGTPLFADNMDYMLSQGKTVYLECSLDTLSRRLKVARSKRPLIAAMDDDTLDKYIVSETARREPFYGRAGYRCPGDRLEDRSQIAETVQYIEKLMNLK